MGRETPQVTTSATDPFVGRESEMAELSAALDDAHSGRGRIVMLAGEPGIGKTRTAEAFTEIGVGRAPGCGEFRYASAMGPTRDLDSRFRDP